MAITRVSQGQEDYSTNTTTFTDALPGTLLPGDVVEFTVTTTSSTATTLTPAASTGTLFSSGVGTSDAVQSQGWYWVLPDPVPAAVSVTAAAARQGTLAWVAYRGVDSTTPMDVAPVQGNQGAASTSTPSMPSITTVTPGAMVVGGICHGSGSTTVTDSGPWTLLVDGTRRNGMIFEKGVQAAAGASGAQTFTLSAGQQSRMWVSALRPAAGEPADPPLEATLTSEPYPGFTGDVADGAAIVYDAANPGSSVVITTNKDTGGGLYVMGLDGQIMSSSLLGAANSVDWRDLTGVSGWEDRLLVMTSDRQINALRYYWLDRTTKALTAAGTTALGWEPYGTCLYVHSGGQVYAFVSQRGPDDTSARNFYQYPLSRSGSTVTAGSAVRTVNVANVVEGMAADDVTGGLFVSQEDVGLYRYSAAPGGGSTRTAVDTVGAGNLVADVEDVAVARSSAGAWLLVSSQGDSSYHVYDLDTFEHVQRFTVVRPGGTDDVTSTDGLDVYLGDFGSAFPDGLIVVHDGDKTPVSDFAFVDAGLVFGELPSTSHAVAGVVVGSSSSSGAVTARHVASGVVAAGTSAAGAVAVARTTSGTVAVESGVAGAVSARHVLAGQVAAVSGASGALSGLGELSGTVEVVSTVTGAATARHTIAGSIAGVSATTGAITSRHTIGGTIAAVSSVSGAVTSETGTTTHAASGTVTLTATTAGTVVSTHTISGGVHAASSATGAVTVHHPGGGNMALPAGVLTAVVRFGPMIDDLGNPFTGRVTFTASRPKVWAATGTPIMPRPLAVQLDEDGMGEIVLPATDQPGFTDGAGNAVTDWTYRVAIDLAGRASETRSFQVPTGGESGVVLDLDLLTPVPSSTGVVVSLPSVLNVAGLTGAITPSALAAALEPELPAPPAPKIPVAGAGTGILATLADFRTGARSIGYAGDSTMNDGQDWPRAFLKMYGAATADGLGIVERQWNTTTETYGSPITIKAGEESEATGGTILDDPFTGTVGDLSGAAIPTGGTWTGTGWSSTGGSAKGSTTAALTFDTGSKDHTNTAHMVVVTSAANPAPQLRVYAGASTAAPHSAGNYVWAQLVVSTGGAVSLSVWKRIGGTNTQIVATDNATGIVANSSTPQNVTVSIELAIQQVTVRLKVGSAEEKVYNGTVTEGDYAVLGTYAGYATLNNTTSALLLDRAVMAVPETPGQMSGLTVWNAAAAGKTLAYHRDRLAAMYPDPLDVLVVSMGHNYGTQSPASFIADVESFLTAFKAAHPETTVVLSSQNPQKAPSLTVAAHAARQAALRDFAFVNGYEYLPGYETFAALPSGGAAFIGPDGVHPTSPTFGTLEDSGAVRWAQAWFDRVENTRLL